MKHLYIFKSETIHLLHRHVVESTPDMRGNKKISKTITEICPPEAHVNIAKSLYKSGGPALVCTCQEYTVQHMDTLNEIHNTLSHLLSNR